ncbi:MAG TPA: TadE/TadG family type IV pilus assembly protein [Candidatus Anammoximicrobium sp.]|nr:TadE/TadG family type IV pilus assembly protein [Candidatus Anammoximicrobium sp.]
MATYLQLCRQAPRNREIRVRRRSGSVTLEFLLVLPILLIVLLSVIEFGMFFTNMQQVALASRLGAEAASQTNLSTATNPNDIPDVIVEAINHQLATSGISPCAIILEHNVPDSTTTTENKETYTSPPCVCAAPTIPAFPKPPAAYARRSVRVTICVPMTELAPNCLAIFGFNLTGRHAQCSTTFRYEG